MLLQIMEPGILYGNEKRGRFGAMDAICHDFKAVLPEDCSAAISEYVHEHTLNCYHKNPLYPLLRVMTSNELLSDLIS
jgi:hypothetical protein